jgi:hypothetical protein
VENKEKLLGFLVVLVLLGIVLLDFDAVHVVVGAEGYDFLVGCDVMDYAAADAVDVKVVAVHECHTTE